MDPLISVQDLAKIYAVGPIRVSALKHVSFRIERGSFTAVMGPSGSGKSTLLNLLGCLDRPTRGRLAIDGVDVSRLNSNKVAALRQRAIGFIFQSFNLLPRLTALENVVAPTLYARLGRSVRRRRASTAARASRADGACRASACGALGRREATRGDCARPRQRPRSSSPTSRRVHSTVAPGWRSLPCCRSSIASRAARSSW